MPPILWFPAAIRESNFPYLSSQARGRSSHTRVKRRFGQEGGLFRATVCFASKSRQILTTIGTQPAPVISYLSVRDEAFFASVEVKRRLGSRRADIVKCVEAALEPFQLECASQKLLRLRFVGNYLSNAV
jgi:hypothetical protein